MAQIIRLRRRLSLLVSGVIATGLIAAVLILAPNWGRAAAATSEDAAVGTISATRTAATAIIGPASVSDGDGLRLNGQRIRLQGVDAFELYQTCETGPCGRAAKAALEELVEGRQVACEPVDTDRYGRTIAYCFVGGADLGEQMVLQGHALAFRRYSTEYVDEEATARRNQAGAWAGTFDNPADWRRANPRG